MKGSNSTVWLEPFLAFREKCEMDGFLAMFKRLFPEKNVADLYHAKRQMMQGLQDAQRDTRHARARAPGLIP
jgi:hypothetical protein